MAHCKGDSVSHWNLSNDVFDEAMVEAKAKAK